ncbi:MAG: hypothetical protein ACFFC1_20000 [Promethearchaeota archaeon]
MATKHYRNHILCGFYIRLENVEIGEKVMLTSKKTKRESKCPPLLMMF